MSIFIFFVILIIGLIVFAFVHKETPSQTESKKPSQPTINKSSKYKISIDTFNSDAPVKELRYFCIKDKGYHTSVWPKDQYIGDFVEFNIAGITHGEHVSEHLGEFVATLEPEPTNPYDPNAIRIVTSNGHRVGYVPRNMTDRIRDFATLPCRCYCYIGTNDGIYFTDCYITRNDQ